MKTAAKDLVRLMALLESQSNATNSLRASHAIGEGSFNSMKVDYQPSIVGSSPLHNPDLLFSQTIKLVDNFVDKSVCLLDLLSKRL